MRTLLRILALVPLVLSAVGPATSGAATIGGAPSDVLSAMAGHWRCTSAGSVSYRSFVVTDGGSSASITGSATTRVAGGIRSSVTTSGAAGATVGIARTVYGRQDGVDAGPFFEKIVERTDKTLSVQTAEGATGTGASDASSMRFSAVAAPATNVSEEAGRGGSGGFWTSSAMRSVSPVAERLSLSYTVDPGGLRRIARLGSQTLSDDRCTRDIRTSSAVCTTANAPAATLHAVQPASTQEGAVQMRLVLDDRGRVVGEDVLSSSSPALTQAAIMAARDSTFTAAVTDCRAVSTQYSFGVQFHADGLRRASSNGRETNL